MDNLTHSLIGLTAAKAGLEKLSPGATALCVLAANSPDSDIVVLIFGGRWEFLQHHRGITHSILGSLVLALALPLVFYAIDRLIAGIRTRESKVKLKGLLLASLLVTATHPIMDWTNNYGMRFLLPWNARWSYGDFVFIIDPFIWIILGGAAFLLTSKTGKQIGVWIALSLIPTYIVTIGAAGTGMLTNQILLCVLDRGLDCACSSLSQRSGSTLWCKHSDCRTGSSHILLFRAGGAHALALRQAKSEAAGIAAPNGEQVLRVAAMPTMANPVNWVAQWKLIGLLIALTCRCAVIPIRRTFFASRSLQATQLRLLR